MRSLVCRLLLPALALFALGIGNWMQGSEPERILVDVHVDPAEVSLTAPQARFTLLVEGRTSAGEIVDLTHEAAFESTTPETVAVSPRGRVSGVADGAGSVRVRVAGRELVVPVRVSNSQAERRLNFEHDIVPILSKAGCNTSGCHGKAEGQNGFKLSVFGSDPPADYAALTQEGRGRRVFVARPGQSLLLAKASGGIPHGGGVRIPRDSSDYATLHAWIAGGLPMGGPTDPHVVSVDVAPRERPLRFGARQQLRVIATDSAGRQFDVTEHSRFQSNNDGLARVDESGLVTVGESPGEVAIMASYMGPVAVFRVLIPQPDIAGTFPELPAENFIDTLVAQKLQKLHIHPSGPASDAEFLRRVSLDITGKLPTAAEARAFLNDDRADRRARLVDELLRRPEYADYWALKWSDVLRVDRQVLGHRRAQAYYRWIRDGFVANKPWDQVCRELLTADGPLDDAPAASFYKVVNQSGAQASTVSQAFLGIRIECAQCHHHPFDRWSQADYLGMQSFFTQVGLSSNASGERLTTSNERATTHPRTGATVFAYALGTSMPEAQPTGDRRRLLADWMTSPENPWFARNLVNRVWAHFLGRGLVDPVDDVRLTNPATNEELLDALARHFVEHHYDIHDLIRTITSSRVYQLSSSPHAANERDEQNYSRAYLKRLDAEVLLDAVCQTTGVPEKFPGVPAGSRAVQLWDSQVPHYFLKLFGRPSRVTACECERTVEPSVAQVLHVLNSPEIQGKLSHAGGRIAEWSRSGTDDAGLIDELYLTYYSRHPDSEERAAGVTHLQRTDATRRQLLEDLAWSLLNTPEFLFNH